MSLRLLWIALVLGVLPATGAQEKPKAGGKREVHLLAMGDWGIEGGEQPRVAEAMAAYVAKSKARFDAVMLAGDNFYGEPKDVNDPQWKNLFERMYDPKRLPMPFYAALGNHDVPTAEVQLEYAKKNPASRWKMPARWYRVDFPEDKPLVTLLMLDSNIDKDAGQLKWLEEQLSKTVNIPWMIVCAHYPLFSNGIYGDNDGLIAGWGKMFQKYKPDFYVCGHDHNLQHLELKEWSTSFLVAGGGGAGVYPMRRDDRGPFSRSLNGFAHLHLEEAKAVVRFLDGDGREVHVFERSAKGEVRVVSTTGRDKPK